MTSPIEIPVPDPGPPLAPAKLRILETADRLFYDEGIRTVGVDRLIAAAHVTKATFYKHYGSKERLVVAYVEYRHRAVAERMAEIAHESGDPAAILRTLRDAIVAAIETPQFRGDAFANAAAEFPDHDHPVRRAIEDHRDWYLGVLEDLLRRMGVPLPGDIADDLMLARDGAMSGGYVGDPIAVTTSLRRAFDRVLGDAATA
ncbi:TetR/AcrR family transcriptional regulator [Pseudolysinimonas sp.]|uniref:TetR/AcrR family transcriptional regulator n=1 Tax=Pseudolysinimonas sp. TaxID=2680009 RepID=UPI003F809DC1